MSSRITDLIAQIKSRGHEVWEAGAATPEAVRDIEAAIGTALPPSYVSFLLSHGGLAIYGTIVSGVNDGDRISKCIALPVQRNQTMRCRSMGEHLMQTYSVVTA